MKLDTSLEEINGVGEKLRERFEKLNIKTIEDLIYHYPNRYQDFSNVKSIKNIKIGEEVTVQGKVIDINSRKTWQKRISITEAIISDETDSIKAIWFNQPYLTKNIKKGDKISIAGEIFQREGVIQFQNPAYEIDNDQNKHTGRIIPVYPETKGITSKKIRNLIKPIIEELELEEWLPEQILKENNFPEINKSIKSIHFPKSKKEIEKARKRFSFEDLFLIQIKNLLEKERLKRENTLTIKRDEKYLDLIKKELPFSLTKSQEKALDQILEDLSKKYPMNRFLQGDVGSGKTIVVALSALNVAKEGYQSAFMAPTEILANQHYESFKSLFYYFEDGIALLTSSQGKIFQGNGIESSPGKEGVLRALRQGDISIVIGTHALIQKKVFFKNLAFAIIDEQHRFGINQRKELIKKSNKKIKPHFLSLSATPIPRTLNLTIFGNLDISFIKELPKGRKKIITKIIKPNKRIEAYKFIKKEINSGKQAFVICPKINKGLDDNPIWSDVKAVKEEYKKLKRIFPNLEIAMLHGKMNPYKKNEVMKDFKDRKYDIMVSTSVIEIGIDVPNATIMIIEGADRFGLAQIHQFRGRVGRSSYQSYCLLFSTSLSEETIKRLKIVERSKDGFELAEKDLEIRGPGEFLGSNQSGVPDLIMEALKDKDLVEKTFSSAKKIVQKDPKLNNFTKIKEKVKNIKEISQI